MIDWKDYFYYDETSPTCLRWAVDVRRGRGYKILFKAKGDVAGSVGKGYSHVGLNGKIYKTSRVVWEMFNGGIGPHHDIDHIDGDIHNNSIGNLRKVTTALNARNSRRRCDNKSGTAGVGRFVKKSSHVYWRVVWYTPDCKRQEKYFSVTKLGEDAAKRLAIDFAKDIKNHLNSLGAGYTDRHGKE